MQWYLKVLSQYADFSGRARRTEYWMFTLVNAIVFAVLVVLAVVLGRPPSPLGGLEPTMIMFAIFSLLFLAVLLPSLAVSVRRLHDTDRSGWWVVLTLVPFGGIVLLVLYAIEGRRHVNSYGPDPKAMAVR